MASPGDSSSASRLHHLALGTSQVEGLARFYRELFGLPEVARHSSSDGTLRSVWLDLGGALLMVEHSSSEARHIEAVGQGLFLIAFRVSPAERSRLERALESRGYPIESRTTYSSYSRDPDGNRIAISHYPES
ncbi:MAG TPA: VOC family protein [Polyangiaceae bacterium]|jgi:catechol-2,3-dioxygenase|nr:VOC family protein [Polyangiaceae bacterium]